MRRHVQFVITALILMTASPARAQSTITLEKLSVTLWPEYDQPSMLVIHEFSVTEDTLVPTTLDFSVPRNANITAVAYESGGSLLLANYQKKPEENGNWQVITLFIAERATYRVEYYQPLERAGERRSFSYRWDGAYPVNEFDVLIRMPGDSTNVKTDPTIPITQQMPFLNGGAMMTGLAEGQSYRLQLSYDRASETPITTPVSSQVQPLLPVDENTDGRSTLDNLPLFLGGVGIVLVAIGAYFFLRGQARTTRKSRQRSRATQRTDTQTYCHECGTRAQESDRFCRACGSKLRQ